VVFALPYGAFTLLGTTDIPVERPEDAVISREEIDYLCNAVNLYFERRVSSNEVVRGYSGVRSLYDNGATSAQAVTRDYHLELDEDSGPKLLSVFGGKITTARALAEEALGRLGIKGLKWTAASALPGGDTSAAFQADLETIAGWLPADILKRLSRSYGTRLKDVLGGATSAEGLGRYFGAGLYEAEARYLVEREFARTAEDILWRRTKLGLHMKAAEQRSLSDWMEAYAS
jgi:glycerol-3-phosphate dehydrogenase